MRTRTSRPFRGRGGAETQSLASGLRPRPRGRLRNPGKWSRVSGLTADFIHALYSSERCHMNCCSQYLISLWLNTGLLNIKAPHQKTCVKEGGSEETR